MSLGVIECLRILVTFPAGIFHCFTNTELADIHSMSGRSQTETEKLLKGHTEYGISSDITWTRRAQNVRKAKVGVFFIHTTIARFINLEFLCVKDTEETASVDVRNIPNIFENIALYALMERRVCPHWWSFEHPLSKYAFITQFVKLPLSCFSFHFIFLVLSHFRMHIRRQKMLILVPPIPVKNWFKRRYQVWCSY